MKTENTIDICLAHNGQGVHNYCPVCHQDFKADIGVVAFLMGRSLPICDGCTKQHAPELWELSQVGQAREADYQQAREAKLQELAGKPLQPFVQIDGFAEQVPDDLFHPDADGNALTAGCSYELFNRPWTVRLFMGEEVTRQHAAGLLTRMLDWVRTSKDWPLTTMPPPLPRMAAPDDSSVPF
jgi:hypothetical protein